MSCRLRCHAPRSPDYLGLTIETMSRQLARLRERRVITVDRGSRHSPPGTLGYARLRYRPTTANSAQL
jgi:hypothetical protein